MVRVFKSTIVDAPVDAVWSLIRDFNSHIHWHPAIAESVIEGGRSGDEVGCVRAFKLVDGAALREQLLAFSEPERSFTYCILDSPIPLLGYVAQVKLSPVTDGRRTFWQWSSSFETPPGREQELFAIVAEGVYQAGFDAVQAHFGGRKVTAPRTGTAGPLAGKAVVQDRHGGPEVLSWRDVEAPAPGPGEVRLRQTAIGVNYIDVYVRTGLYPMLKPPGTIGMEAAGVVEAVGADVVGLSPGDRVAYACPPVGAYATVRTMAAGQLVLLPDEIDDRTAAAIMLKGMTAEYLLHRTHAVKAGDVVLVHAAAGGVGLMLCQWARHIGATVIGTVGSEAKAKLARDHGCDYPIVTPRGGGFAERVKGLTGGRGADVVYDGIGRDSFEDSLEALALCGHLVSYGQASGPVPPVEPARLSGKSLTLSRPVLFHYTADRRDLTAIATRLFDVVRRGVVKVEIGQTFPLAEAAEAHRALEGRRTTGSTVLTA